jgi:hypothetical protein
MAFAYCMLSQVVECSRQDMLRDPPLEQPVINSIVPWISELGERGKLSSLWTPTTPYDPLEKDKVILVARALLERDKDSDGMQMYMLVLASCANLLCPLG